MGFGFANNTHENSGILKEIEYNHKDTIRAHDWDTVFLGARVKSVITGTEGEIIEKMTGFFNEIRIAWDNGKESFAKHRQLNKVIIID